LILRSTRRLMNTSLLRTRSPSNSWEVVKRDLVLCSLRSLTRRWSKTNLSTLKWSVRDVRKKYSKLPRTVKTNRILSSKPILLESTMTKLRTKSTSSLTSAASSPSRRTLPSVIASTDRSRELPTLKKRHAYWPSSLKLTRM
jgi:hypothetical protein